MHMLRMREVSRVRSASLAYLAETGEPTRRSDPRNHDLIAIEDEATPARQWLGSADL